MLMSPTDSKQGKNRSGVRMFKDGKEVKAEGGMFLGKRDVVSIGSHRSVGGIR
jgi:hypothetical protein